MIPLRYVTRNSGSPNAIVALRWSAIAICFVLAGCSKALPPPPPHVMFDGLPVSGTLADARAGGFTNCAADTTTMRCRREGVMLVGHGPYSAAIDLYGSDGRGGFDQVILWHNIDQYGVYAIADELEKNRGWSTCMTGTDERGDQQIYTRKGEKVRVSMDLSYWGKRRIRIIPDFNRRDRQCTPAAPRPATPRPTS